MACEHRPSLRVVEEARDYLKAAQLIEQHAYSGNSRLFWPAAMNAGLASELYLKSFLVESDPDHPADMDDPEGFLKLMSGLPSKHDLLALYEAIPAELAKQLRQISNRLSPGFPLEERIRTCSNLFVETRYTYEARSAQRFDTEVFELAPHLDRVLEEMTRQLVSN
ncbi:hypothetical protein HX866_08555 [Pseudomonas gingeri]|uniref:hypothetical protein n=1 Tax=Pseudomonas gingeri TaxID=117681 RepID=UPI0015A3D922|nr:hypothetical protein [Pseudomonas gingeri]NWA24940.1 hypothetical protein [Pseudomonas gingeri]